MTAGDTAAVQAWATDGVAPLAAHGWPTRLLLRVVAAAERLNRSHARLGNPPVYASAAFPWAARLEAATPRIARELAAVMRRAAELPNIQDITPDARSITDDARWKVFLLTGYGVASPDNIPLCPETWRALAAVPGLKTAMFSILEPGKRVPPHRGPYNGVLRLHLGVHVPVTDPAIVGMRVAGATLGWREGEAVIFDDAYEHAVWNDSARPRVVLFVDFAKPLRFPANLINRALLALAPYTPYLRDGAANLRRWEAAFHGHAR